MKKIKEYLKKGITIILIIFLISFILFEQVREQTILFMLSPIMNPLIEGVIEEDEERQRKKANGEEVEYISGKDTVFEWHDKYYITKGGYDNRKTLSIRKRGTLFGDILDRVEDYSFLGTSIYVVSYEGYAVIDKNDLCKVYITVPLEDFIAEKEYGVTPKGERLFYSGKTESEYVVYLDSFDDYSKEEQDKLKEMIQKLK